jgi:electron transfer DM13
MIDEPEPIGVIASNPVPSATPPASASPGPLIDRPSDAAPATPTSRPVAAVERSGTFVGADDFHFARGGARLVEVAPGEFTVRLEDFAVRNGPDLFVYLSPSGKGYAKEAIELGRLKADRGNQNYRVPAGTDVTSAMSVVIWCRQFGVLFGTATLT